MWKYFSVLVFVLLVVLAIGFVRDNYWDAKSPLHSDLKLAANFGEIRPDHFHMGVDIRTNGKENMPVYAIEDGFVSAVKIEPYGYGKVIFLQHPDGKTSLYAHLNRFNDSLEAFVRRKQYATQSWQQEINCAKDAFPVKKGELIAYSGNTGRSEGPHLHFELRDTRTAKNLNPALHGFTVADHTPPVIQGLYWYDRRYSTYEKGPVSIAVDGDKGSYHARKKIMKVSSPVISLGIRAEDRVDGSRFRYGIYKAEIWLDDELVHEFALDNFSCDDSRYVNAFIDYSYRVKTGLTIQHLSRLPGNRLQVYKGSNGLIHLKDTLLHRIKIRVTDVAGNESDLNLTVQRSRYDAVEHEDGVRRLVPGKAHILKTAYAELQFDKHAFYDTVDFVLKKDAASGIVHLHKPVVPVHSRYLVKVKADGPVRQKTVMLFTGARNKMVIKGEWEGDFMKGWLNELGIVQLVVDNVAPGIETVGWNEGEVFSSDISSISISAKDNLGEVANLRAELDGKWILMEQKGNVFSYEFDERCKTGKHRLVVAVRDVAGNVTSRSYSFSRLLVK